MQTELPTVRGPITSALFSHWTDGTPTRPLRSFAGNPLVDDDLHLALWACYQLHYGGFGEVPDGVEWDTDTLAFRALLEARFEQALRDEHPTAALPDDPVTALGEISSWPGPPLSSFVEHHGTIAELREFAVHRSAYQLKEADPHTWAIPRLTGPARSAMLEIQIDEYGGGEPGQAHSELFADAMEELGLVSEVGHYVDQLPGSTLATDNLVSMFGLHRRLRGALIGHLALFEMCSVVPMTRYLTAARRVGDLAALERFYKVHVDVDTHHAALALDHMVAELVAAEPGLAAEVIFGAAALSRVESRFAVSILRAWDRGDCSLLPPEPACGAGAGASTEPSMAGTGR